MPIYRLPVVTSSLPLRNFSNSSSNQDGRHHHHQHPHQHYVDQQPTLHMQQQQQLDPNENIIKRSHSIPTQVRMTAVDYSTPTERVSIDPSEESIVEREIRLQLEREAEIASLHGGLRARRSTKQADASNHNHGDYAAEDEAAHSAEMRREPRGTLRDVIEDGRHVINQYSKAGESLIVKELLEQKRREEELRNHRRNIGMLRTDETADRRLSAEGDRTRPSAGETATQAPSANIRAVLRVQPFEDPEDEPDSKQTFITPRMETVIEREVRLQRQREGSLRRARGYPLQSREDRLTEVEIYPLPAVKMGHPGDQRGLQSGLERRAVYGEVLDELSVQRFATNRLKQEMLRERQRELDLRRQGTIYTISEERVGFEPEEFSSNQLYPVEDSMNAVGSASLSSSRGEFTANLREPEYLQQFQPNDFYSDNDQTVLGLAVVENQPSEKLPSWRTAAELRIEEEVKEARRREKELREERRLANAALINQLEQQQPIQHQQNLSSQQHSRNFYRRT